MIEKMKYVNLMGEMSRLDYTVEEYLYNYEIQLEYTTKELPNEKDLIPFSEANPFISIARKAENLYKMTNLKDYVKKDISSEEAVNVIDYADKYIEDKWSSLRKLEERRDKYIEARDQLEPFKEIDFKIEVMRDFEYIHYQFGNMPVASFKQFETFIYKNSDILIVTGKNDGRYISCVYFSSTYAIDKVDSLFSSLHFERMDVPLEVNGEALFGTVFSVYHEMGEKAKALEDEIAQMHKSMFNIVNFDKDIHFDEAKIISAYNKIKNCYEMFEIRRYAAKTPNDFYIFVGWMPPDEAIKLEKAVAEDSSVVFIVEDENEAIKSTPPTKLKNLNFIRPFEFFTKMYGLPNYDEIDPTPFLAVTYTVLFGIMFGDVGQGFVLSLGGWLLSRFKKLALGKILQVIGISSIFFGFVYGSFFGYEFGGLWGSPMHSMNTILIYAVIGGVCIIFMSMFINIANAVKKKRFKEVLFDPNGVSGIVFYASILAVFYLSFLGHKAVALWILIVFILIPIILIGFREPIIKKLNGEKRVIKGNLGLFLFETFIGIFEVVLSYFTNTLSFIRVGAFALSHACMMTVVMLLSETTSGHNLLIVILGNILVMALEGLIAGIQVLRIEFYEMFSRFFKGDGRKFVPHKEN